MKVAADQATVVQPDQGKSFWQPVPANGHVELKVSQQDGPIKFDSGIQAVAPGGYVREHAHDAHQEIIFVYQGSGTAVIEGEEFPMQPGTTLLLDPLCKHKFINTGSDEMRFFWTLLPGGLNDFFSAIGRERKLGEQAPTPFPRPADVAAIEANTVFAKLEN